MDLTAEDGTPERITCLLEKQTTRVCSHFPVMPINQRNYNLTLTLTYTQAVEMSRSQILIEGWAKLVWYSFKTFNL